MSARLSEAMARVVACLADDPGLRLTSMEIVSRTRCPRHQVLRALRELRRGGIVDCTQVTHQDRVYRLTTQAKELL